jgi:hypothetical protein
MHVQRRPSAPHPPRPRREVWRIISTKSGNDRIAKCICGNEHSTPSQNLYMLMRSMRFRSRGSHFPTFLPRQTIPVLEEVFQPKTQIEMGSQIQQSDQSPEVWRQRGSLEVQQAQAYPENVHDYFTYRYPRPEPELINHKCRIEHQIPLGYNRLRLAVSSPWRY